MVTPVTRPSYLLLPASVISQSSFDIISTEPSCIGTCTEWHLLEARWITSMLWLQKRSDSVCVRAKKWWGIVSGSKIPLKVHSGWTVWDVIYHHTCLWLFLAVSQDVYILQVVGAVKDGSSQGSIQDLKNYYYCYLISIFMISMFKLVNVSMCGIGVHFVPSWLDAWLTIPGHLQCLYRKIFMDLQTIWESGL